MLRITTRVIVLMTAILMSTFGGYSQDKTSNIGESKQKLISDMTAKNKELMREEIELINMRLSDGEIDAEEANTLKKDVALKYAQRIKYETQRIDIAYENTSKGGYSIRIGGEDFFSVKSKQRDRRDSIMDSKIRDRRTYSDIVLAFGFNNVLVEGQSLNDSPFKAGGSRFFELGYAWKTRVFKNSNWLRFKYGLSLQYNNFKPKDNQYFVKEGNLTQLEVFPEELKKSKIRFTNLVVPLHFEIGPSKKIERENYFRYQTHNKFKVGLGGYAGLRIGTRQKLKYTLNGDNKKDKIKSDFNANDFIIGLSGYLSWGRIGLYGKYELTPLFRSPNTKMNNIALGVRFDMD